MDALPGPTPYERAQIDKIEAWRQAPPGLLEHVAGIALSPLTRAIARVMPPRAIEALLLASDWLAEQTLRAANAPDYDAPLEALDDEAGRIRNWAVAYASGEGAIAGAAGLVSLPLDIPATVALSLRTIRRIGRNYGYDAAGEEERRFVHGVLAIASANSAGQKRLALDRLHEIGAEAHAQQWAILGERAARRAVRAESMLLLVRDLAEQLGINLSRRKVLAAMPIVGAAIGATVNGWYMRDIAIASQRAYQERWLRDQGRFPDAV
jgi:hypothetical protein